MHQPSSSFIPDGFSRNGAKDGAKGRRLRLGKVSPNPGGLERLEFAPNGLLAGAPLVVVLHGCTQTAEAYASGAGWLDLAERHGFAVLCPQQIAANNPNRCFNWFLDSDTARGCGEAASIAAMVHAAVSDHGSDPDRVFITGLSAGGAMAGVLAATYPELFAGVGIIAGLPYGAASTMGEAFAAMTNLRARTASEWGDAVRAASTHQGPWPKISIWHGDGDMTVRPASAEALIAQWTDVHSPAEAQHRQSADGRAFEAWVASDGCQVVEVHRIAGMGHGTPVKTRGPQACGAPGPFLLDVNVGSSREMAQTWGILNEDERHAHDVPGQDAITNSADRPARETTVQDRVSRTIEEALKAAGLLR